MDEAKWFVGILTILVAVWLLAGGSDRLVEKKLDEKDSDTTLFSGLVGQNQDSNIVRDTKTESSIKEVQKKELQEEIDQAAQEVKRIEEEIKRINEQDGASRYAGKVTILSSRAKDTDPDKEYITIRANKNNTETIPITGWRLESGVTGRRATIGKGSQLPISGQTVNDQTIFLAPGEMAIVVSGRSPLGSSFRLNLCTGYLEQFQNFSPRLPRDCPDPEDEPEVVPKVLSSGMSDACISFIERIPRCSINTKPIPQTLESSCHQFINREINYNACVTRHRQDEGFYLDEWRVFLSRDEELWRKEREIIKLVDTEDKVVLVETY